MEVVLFRRAVPVAVAAILIGLPLMADGVQNPPTASEIEAMGRASPRISQYLQGGQLIQVQELHLDLMRARVLKAAQPSRLGPVDDSGLWQVIWQIETRGQVVTITQWFNDRNGRLLLEEIFPS